MIRQAYEPTDELRDSRAKNWFWDHDLLFDLGLSCYALVVRFYLAKCAGKNQTAWPSLSNIAAHCGISRKTAKKAVDELVARGLITKEARISHLGDYSSNIYTLLDPKNAGSGKGNGAQDTLPLNEMQTTPEEEGRVRDTLPCNEMQGVGSEVPYLGSEVPDVGSVVPDVGSVVHSNNNKRKVLDSVVVVNNPQTTLTDTSEDLAAAELFLEKKLADAKNDTATKTGSHSNINTNVMINDFRDVVQGEFAKTSGQYLPESVLDELSKYPENYVLQKIDLLKTGKPKKNAVGWLLEACRNNYQPLQQLIPQNAKEKGETPQKAVSYSPSGDQNTYTPNGASAQQETQNEVAASQEPGDQAANDSFADGVEADKVTAQQERNPVGNPGEQRLSPFKSRKQQEMFDAFWREYPRRRAKGNAEKAWVKISPNEQLFEAIMSGLKLAKASEDWIKDGGKYIPYPASWLNAKGWEDEYTATGVRADGQHGQYFGTNSSQEIDFDKFFWKGTQSFPLP